MTYVLRAYTRERKPKPVALLHVSGNELCGGLGFDKPRTWQTKEGAERYAARPTFRSDYEWRAEQLLRETTSIERTVRLLEAKFIAERAEWVKSVRGMRTIPHTTASWQHVRHAYMQGLEEGWAACYEAVRIANQK